jgi:hypothetical protein
MLKHPYGTTLALANVPRYCTATTFVVDSRLFTGASKPPTVSTVRNWMRTGKCCTAVLAGKTYIDLHSTLRKWGAAK